MHANRTLALQLTAITLGMLMLAYASVPLYRMFCQVTGFGGTSQRAAMQSTRVLDRRVTVTFDANTDPRLPWKFEPIEKSVTVRLGENRLVAFRATNLSDKTTRATATYNVTPFAVGSYFNKIQCFCFKEQQLGPHQSAIMPVSFFVDPAMIDDPETREVTNITLSYTFFSYESANKSKL
ncbi:MAG: cytochrome c oxidase assembly protein [Alphaproteobacteria bacterium]|nr:cytochrome c oxidase assembly protein [Alphaproteobacteria bacterium]